jgi:hypothetical protein
VLRFCLDATLGRSNGRGPARITLRPVQACRPARRVNHLLHYTTIAGESDTLGWFIRKKLTHDRPDRRFVMDESPTASRPPKPGEAAPCQGRWPTLGSGHKSQYINCLTARRCPPCHVDFSPPRPRTMPQGGGQTEGISRKACWNGREETCTSPVKG